MTTEGEQKDGQQSQSQQQARKAISTAYHTIFPLEATFLEIRKEFFTAETTAIFFQSLDGLG